MKKIMFNDKFGLTKAVLDGRKTMTRRIVPKKMLSSYQFISNVTSGNEKEFFLNRCSVKVDDIFAISMSYNHVFYELHYGLPEDISTSPGWKNKMFVRSEYMPWAIKITDVRVERLQDISEEDCLKEGIVTYSKDGFVFKYDLSDGFEMFSWQTMKRTPKEAFAALINKVSGKGTWDSNPYVFVYTFEVIPNPNKKE